jgi:hypothetical protein
MKAVLALIEACRRIIKITSPAESENRDGLDLLQVQVIEALCLCEAELPATELSVLFHTLVHATDGIYRWNNVRNYWCFFSERSINHNIMLAYVNNLLTIC